MISLRFVRRGSQAAAEIGRRGTTVVPATEEPTPGPAPAPASPPVPSNPTAPCGYCEAPQDGHGVRYSTFGGRHEWRRWEGPRNGTLGGNR